MRTLALVLFCGVLGIVSSVGPQAAAAPVPKHLIKEAPPAIDGVWKLESMKRGDKAFPLAAGSMILEFRGGTLVTVMNPNAKEEVRSTAALTHDVDQKRIRAIEHRNAAGKLVQPDSAYGYTLEADKLTLATSQAANLTFGPADPLKPGPNDVVLVLTRVKEK